ncbi:hypothetical protein JIN84_05145 [Luteolibacter yonseiensis]|uniref:Uncharacterized protein n=1 Tax=Luteolibacter yonseiensis TaxID=1144680 RepID=A0A934VB33_9BACT|nr:hypothetical protein [Luteolibacter yonseiensis]MBK1814989.1 hypothetical protein [Luteolibacter yonseiensis]
MMLFIEIRLILSNKSSDWFRTFLNVAGEFILKSICAEDYHEYCLPFRRAVLSVAHRRVNADPHSKPLASPLGAASHRKSNQSPAVNSRRLTATAKMLTHRSRQDFFVT